MDVVRENCPYKLMVLLKNKENMVCHSKTTLRQCRIYIKWKLQNKTGICLHIVPTYINAISTSLYKNIVKAGFSFNTDINRIKSDFIKRLLTTLQPSINLLNLCPLIFLSVCNPVSYTWLSKAKICWTYEKTD